MKIAKKENKRRSTMMIRFDYELTFNHEGNVGYCQNQHSHEINPSRQALPVIQF